MAVGTTQGFVTKAFAVHGDTYDYSDVEYVDKGTRVSIRCKVHGVFAQTPANHLRGRGCRACGWDKLSGERRCSTEEFVERATKVHNGKFTYEAVEYVGALKKVTMTCPLHGHFRATPNSHLQGRGCKSCGDELTAVGLRREKEDVIKQATKKHGGLYDYLDFDHKNGLSKMNVICKEHGVFQPTVCGHVVAGTGCPACSVTGYDRKKPGRVYVLVAGDLTKVGITNLTVKQRLSQIKTCSRIDFLHHSDAYFEDGLVASNVERALLKEFKQNYRQPTEKFDGYTECFYALPAELVIKRIKELAAKYQNEQYSSQPA